jgi:hypothetical protein
LNFDAILESLRLSIVRACCNLPVTKVKTPLLYHRFAYSMPLRAGEMAKPSKIRDGAAFTELTAPLAKLGYEYGDIIFNSPFDPKRDKKLGQEHFNFIKPKDLIVLATRPPLDDRRHGDKKHLDESYTHLEEQVFAEFRKYLAICARSHVQLTQAIGADFEKADFMFYQHKSARLKFFKRLDEFRNRKPAKDSETAIGFFLRTPAIPVYRCGLLACFGMGGWETLIWNRIVRTRFPKWVNRPSFVIGQFDMRGLPPRPPTLDFVDRIKVEILLEHTISG